MKREDTIKVLIDKYLEGQTTTKEETYLSEYFSGDDVKPEWLIYKSMFSFFEISKEQQPSKPFIPQRNTFWKSWPNIAAVLMLVVTTSLFFKTQQAANQDLGTFDDPELALQETIRVFDMIGDKFNSGKKEMEHLNILKDNTKYINIITP